LRWNLRVVVEVGGFLFMALQIEYHIITAIWTHFKNSPSYTMSQGIKESALSAKIFTSLYLAASLQTNMSLISCILQLGLSGIN
jgi:hypothetical protein